MGEIIKNGIKDVIITPLNIINTNGGSVYHAIKKTDNGFLSFGEAYFSSVEYKLIKGWKKHKKMTLNFIVPVGIIKFVIHDLRTSSKSYGFYQEITLSNENYNRLTIPPDLWFAFQGLAKNSNFLLNIANLIHDPNEVLSLELDKIKYDW